MKTTVASSAYLGEAVDLVLVLGRVVLLGLEGAQEHIDLGDGDLGQGVVPSWAAGTRAGTRTQHTCLRRMWRVGGDSCLETLGRSGRKCSRRSWEHGYWMEGRRGEVGSATQKDRAAPLHRLEGWRGDWFVRGCILGNAGIGGGREERWRWSWELGDRNRFRSRDGRHQNTVKKPSINVCRNRA